MRAPHWIVGVILPVLAAVSVAQAATIPFDLQGKAGNGLLPGNENHAISGVPGSGGEVGAGITYNDSTNLLNINIGWGSGMGFINLSSATTGGHIHGPTASPAPASFLEDAGIIIPLDSLAGWNGSSTNGGFSGTPAALSETQEGQLLAGRLYINIHTSTNPAGEIRGYLIAVPEPTSAALLLLAAPALLRRRRA